MTAVVVVVVVVVVSFVCPLSSVSAFLVYVYRRISHSLD